MFLSLLFRFHIIEQFYFIGNLVGMLNKEAPLYGREYMGMCFCTPPLICGLIFFGHPNDLMIALAITEKFGNLGDSLFDEFTFLCSLFYVRVK